MNTLFAIFSWVCLIGFVLFLIIGIVSLVRKKGKKSLKWFGFSAGSIVVFIGLIVLSIKISPSEQLYEEVTGEAELTDSVEDVIELDNNSFNIKQKTIQYNKDDNSLFLEFETNLPNDTILNMVLNLYQPDTWNEYASFNSYSSRLEQRDIELRVENGLISFKLDNAQLNKLLVPNSKVDVRFFIPVSNEINSFVKKQYPNSTDFKEAYPNLDTSGDESDEYEILSDWFNSELTNAYTAEEIYAYYKAESIPYKELEKNPSKYEGTPISFTGEILQIQTDEVDNPDNIMLDNNSVMRLAVNGDLDQVVFVTVQDASGMEGIVSDDTITVYGNMTGSKTYESVAGYEITIPSMEAVIYVK